MNDKVTLGNIESDLYKQITAQSKIPIEYTLFHRKVRMTFVENHSLHESVLNVSDKILISKEDASTERLEILMGLGLISRDYYMHTLIDFSG